MTEFIASIAGLRDRYDALFCDLWGVVHNGREAFPPAIAALTRWRETGGKVILISNVPKPRDPIPGQLDRLKVPRAAWDAIVTSGDAIRAELARRAPGPMYRIGPGEDDSLWAGLGLTETRDIDAAGFVAISGLDDPATETPDDYAPLLAAMALRRLEMLCANPDLVVRVGDRLIWCAGAVAQAYAERGGPVVMAGKPWPPIYALAFAELETLGAAADRTRVLAVGDGLGTDVRGAEGAGIDCVFIASGLHGEALKTEGGLDPQKVAIACGEEGVSPRYVMAGLA